MKTNYLNLPRRKPRTRKDILAYLKEHYRYSTLNSWNGCHSYAHNVKISRLNLPREVCDACYDMLEIDEAFEETRALIWNFELRHDWRWQIGFNGRSGGYLVLYQGGREVTNGKARTYSTGKGTHQNPDELDELDMADLQEWRDLIRDFDNTCEMAVAAFVEFARTHTVEEREVMVPKTIRVAVPAA